jgi:hypothetical protein
MPWNTPAQVADRGRLITEVFERGALAGNDPAAVPLTARHPRDAESLPIGVTVELEDRADAAWGAWKVSRVPLGDEVLELARDGVPLALSVGFMEVPGGSRWSPDRRRVARTRAALDHVAVVRVGAYPGRWRGRGSGRGRRAVGDPARHPGPPLAVAMGKQRFWVGRSGRPFLCLGGCKRPVFYGDRCPSCQRELRQRQRRKRR